MSVSVVYVGFEHFLKHAKEGDQVVVMMAQLHEDNWGRVWIRPTALVFPVGPTVAEDFALVTFRNGELRIEQAPAQAFRQSVVENPVTNGPEQHGSFRIYRAYFMPTRERTRIAKLRGALHDYTHKYIEKGEAILLGMLNEECKT